jgi:hypothetical protein
MYPPTRSYAHTALHDVTTQTTTRLHKPEIHNTSLRLAALPSTQHPVFRIRNGDEYSLPMNFHFPVAERSKARVCSWSLAWIAGSNLAWAWMSVSCECWVVSDRCLCDGPIPRPEESYRLWFDTVWSRNIKNTAVLAHVGLLRHRKKN